MNFKIQKTNKILITMSAIAATIILTGCGGGGGGSSSNLSTPPNNNKIILIDDNQQIIVKPTPTPVVPSPDEPDEDEQVINNPVPVDPEPIEDAEETTITEPIHNPEPVIEKWITSEYENSGLSQIGANVAYENGWTGKNIKIAVIDSGLNFDHQEFAGRNVESKSFNKLTYDESSGNTYYDGLGLDNGQIEDVTFTSDSIFGSTPTITISGDGSGASAVAILDADGKIESIKMTGHGTGYTNATVLVNGIPLSDSRVNLAGTDTFGHGTAVTSLAAGNKDMSDANSIDNGGTQGVAFDSDILSIKIFRNEAEGIRPSAPSLFLNSAIDYATANNAKVLNLSIGTTVESGLNTNATLTSFRNALDNNSSIVVASGNEFKDCKRVNGSLDGNCAFPAALPWLSGNEDLLTRAGGWVVVGAVDSNNNMAAFSNYAGVMASNYLVAPGVANTVASHKTDDGYGSGSGTSYAAPYVSGAMALMYQRYSHLDGNQIAKIFFDTATDLGAQGVDEVYGNGLINLEKAFAPIGTLTIPKSTNANATATMNLAGTGMMSTKAFGNSLLNVKGLDKTIALDSYKRDYNFKLSNAVASTTDDDNLADESFSFDNLNILQQKNFLIGVNQNKEFALGYKVSENFHFMLAQESDLYGLESSGAFQIGSAKTTYLQASYKTRLNSKFNLVTKLEYGRGTANTSSNSMITDISTVNAIGGKVALEYNNAFGVSLEVPRKIVSGKMDFNVPTSRGLSTVNFEKVSADLTPDATEQKFAIYGKYTEKAFSLMATAERTENKNHISGNSENNISVNLQYTF